jgi:SRSO17 transposase
MAAMAAPARTAAQHPSMLHLVGQAPWPEDRRLAKVEDFVLPRIEAHGSIRAWIGDDTAFPKKAKHAAGVTRQAWRHVAKQDKGQVAVTLDRQ